MPASIAPGGPFDARPRVATPTDVSAAIEARRRRETRRRRIVVAAVAAALVLALVLLWLVRFSGVLAARTVVVHGTSRVTAEQVAQVAQVPLGTPLVRLDERAIGARVADQLAPVAQVRVHSQLPNTVVIDVTERTPVYQRAMTGQYQLVDEHGVVFALLAKPAPGLLQVTTPSVDNQLLASVATVVKALPPALRQRVRSIDAQTLDQVTLRLDKGQTVIWGSAEQSDVKGGVVLTLLARKVSVVDVSSPSTPTTR